MFHRNAIELTSLFRKKDIFCPVSDMKWLNWSLWLCDRFSSKHTGTWPFPIYGSARRTHCPTTLMHFRVCLPRAGILILSPAFSLSIAPFFKTHNSLLSVIHSEDKDLESGWAGVQLAKSTTTIYFCTTVTIMVDSAVHSTDYTASATTNGTNGRCTYKVAFRAVILAISVSRQAEKLHVLWARTQCLQLGLEIEHVTLWPNSACLPNISRPQRIN